MKKKVSIVVIVVILIILMLALILGVTFAKLNKEKESITANEFLNNMTAKGYYVEDGTYQFYNYDFVNKVYLAIENNYNYQIEFYEFESDSNALDFYYNNKSIFESQIGNAELHSEANLKNYSKYTLETDGKYKVVSRINNTAIFVNVDSEYKNEVKALLENLGY